MILRLTIDGVQYDVDVMRILNTEAIAVQKVTGYGYDEWLNKCDEGDAEAITAMVWIAMKRKPDHHDLKFRDVTFPMREVWGGREYITDDIPEDADGDEAVPTPPAEAGQTEPN